MMKQFTFAVVDKKTNEILLPEDVCLWILHGRVDAFRILRDLDELEKAEEEDFKFEPIEECIVLPASPFKDMQGRHIFHDSIVELYSHSKVKKGKNNPYNVGVVGFFDQPHGRVYRFVSQDKNVNGKVLTKALAARMVVIGNTNLVQP